MSLKHSQLILSSAWLPFNKDLCENRRYTVLMILYAEERLFSHALANTQFCFSTAPPCLYSLANSLQLDPFSITFLLTGLTMTVVSLIGEELWGIDLKPGSIPVKEEFRAHCWAMVHHLRTMDPHKYKTPQPVFQDPPQFSPFFWNHHSLFSGWYLLSQQVELPGGPCQSHTSRNMFLLLLFFRKNPWVLILCIFKFCLFSKLSTMASSGLLFQNWKQLNPALRFQRSSSISLLLCKIKTSLIKTFLIHKCTSFFKCLFPQHFKFLEDRYSDLFLCLYFVPRIFYPEP